MTYGMHVQAQYTCIQALETSGQSCNQPTTMPSVLFFRPLSHQPTTLLKVEQKSLFSNLLPCIKTAMMASKGPSPNFTPLFDVENRNGLHVYIRKRKPIWIYETNIVSERENIEQHLVAIMIAVQAEVFVLIGNKHLISHPALI
jgi:hypothetical protein